KLQLSLAGDEAASATARANGDTIPVDMQSLAQETLNYTVRKGDSLWLISRRFGVSIVQLQAWNKLARGSVLRPGQVLIVYRTEQLAQGA
ncbi:MAG: LysM peptidoglycan-binding domain-containing protein, partial [Gammaproteobacteria bacterium]